MLSSRFVCSVTTAVCITLGTLTTPTWASDHLSVKRPVNPPPSAELLYTITARHSGLTLGGDARINWTTSAKRFDIAVDTKASLLGKLLESHSEGTIDDYGLTPLKLTEKRFRKQPFSVNFGRHDKTIRFTESAITYPLRGGEQDRTSITWQLISIARGAPDKIRAGTQWSFLVAGRSDAEVWAFKVLGRETIRTPLGEFSAVHITKLPSKDREQQKLDLWLAPALEWYPLRVAFKDTNGLELDQMIRQVNKR